MLTSSSSASLLTEPSHARSSTSSPRRRRRGQHARTTRRLVSALALAPLVQVSGIAFYQDPREINCFYVAAVTGAQSVQLNYEVDHVDGGSPGVSFSVHNRKKPEQKLASSQDSKLQIHLGADALQKGSVGSDMTLAICFEATHGSGRQLVNLDVAEEGYQSGYPATMTHAERTAALANQMTGKMAHIRSQQEFSLTREAIRKEGVESLRAYTMYWKAAEALCVFVFAFMQVSVLRGYFETKACV
ncbi:unnamed protein product [Amoebophrya sp. A25]|nr:unnamed protein product [Amoebophrya sp. A25]|eukprot:GSA25T00010267001.1